MPNTRGAQNRAEAGLIFGGIPLACVEIKAEKAVLTGLVSEIHSPRRIWRLICDFVRLRVGVRPRSANHFRGYTDRLSRADLPRQGPRTSDAVATRRCVAGAQWVEMWKGWGYYGTTFRGEIKNNGTPIPLDCFGTQRLPSLRMQMNTEIPWSCTWISFTSGRSPNLSREIFPKASAAKLGLSSYLPVLPLWSSCARQGT